MIAALVVLAPQIARAEQPPDWGMPAVLSVDALANQPAAGGPAAYGAGITMAVVPRKIAYGALVGGFTVTPRSNAQRTDTFSFGADASYKADHENGDSFVPFAGLSFRVLSVSHYTATSRDRFTTFGFGGNAGFMGDLPGGIAFYRAQLTALAASAPDDVPGTSLVLSVGVGTRFGF